MRERRARNPEHYRAVKRERYYRNGGYTGTFVVQRQRILERNHRWVWEYKLTHPCVGTLAGPCAFGPVTDPRVLEFDHIGDDKERNVGTMLTSSWSIARIQQEIDKCVVRCRNCHSIVTQERGDHWAFRYYSDTAAMTAS